MKRPRLRDEPRNLINRMSQQAIQNVGVACSLAEQMRQRHRVFPPRHAVGNHAAEKSVEVLPRSRTTMARWGDHLGIEQSAQGLADDLLAGGEKHLDQPSQERVAPINQTTMRTGFGTSAEAPVLDSEHHGGWLLLQVVQSRETDTLPSVQQPFAPVDYRDMAKKTGGRTTGDWTYVVSPERKHHRQRRDGFVSDDAVDELANADPIPFRDGSEVVLHIGKSVRSPADDSCRLRYRPFRY